MRFKPVILVALPLAAFLVNLDTTLVNVAFPAMVRQLHATTAQLQWGGRRLQPGLRRAAAHLRQPVRPVRPQGMLLAGTAEAAHQAEAHADPASPVR